MKVKIKMSEFFIELFSEEIPANLQVNARKNLYEGFKKFFDENGVSIKGRYKVFSTPNRLILNIDKISKVIIKKAEEIRGPSLNAPNAALEGFIRSNNIKKNQIFKKKTEKGDFYFFKRTSKKIKTADLIKENITSILDKISWNKSMKWNNHDLFWGRPLKSILTVFDGKKLEFNFHHLISSNSTFIEKDLEEQTKSFDSFKSYYSYFKSKGVIINHEKRKSIILNELTKLSKKKILQLF